MSATILDGKALAAKIRESLPKRRARLAIVSSPGAQSYLRAKLKACEEAGIETLVVGPSTKAVRKLARDGSVDAIILDTPLPKNIDANEIPPEKDAEGVTPFNFGRLLLAKSFAEVESRRLIVPCTAMAVIRLLQQAKIQVAGKNAVVVGRSNILGKPTAHLLTMLDATVTLCHSKTKNLASIVRTADIVIACLGQPRFIKGSWIKRGAVVIDAGVNTVKGKLCGDVAFDQAVKVASHITPVPGGVGPVTVAMLLKNTLALA